MADRIAELKAVGLTSANGNKQVGHRILSDDDAWYYYNAYSLDDESAPNAAAFIAACQLWSDAGLGTKATIESFTAMDKAIGPQISKLAESGRGSGVLQTAAPSIPAVPAGLPMQAAAPSISGPQLAPESVAASSTLSEGPLPPQETQIFFTDSRDSLVGDPAGTTFIGNELTVQSYDRIVGVDGFNSAAIQLNASPNANGPLSFVATNIDRVSIALSNVGTPVSVSAEWWTQVKEFWVSGPSADGLLVNLQDIQENMTIGFEDYSGTVNYGFSHLPSNAATFLGLVLKGGSEVVAEIRTGDGAGFQQLDITSAGSAKNYLTLALPDQTDGKGLTSLFLSGDAPLVISARGHEFRELSYIDAKNAAGGIRLEIDGAAPLEFFGGNGNDYLKLKLNNIELIEIDGGAGVDALEIGGASLAQLSDGVVRNVEELLLRGTLTASASISNTAGFESIELLNRTTDYGHDLYLNEFSWITINDDQKSLIHISGGGASVQKPVTIEFELGADVFGSLDISSVRHAEFVTNDLGQVVINSLKLAPHFSPEGSSLSFSGEGNFKVGGVQGGVDLVDLSGLEGSWIGGDVFGVGTDFLVGDLSGNSTIWLDAKINGKASRSEIVFGAGEPGSGLHGTVQIHEFDLIDPVMPTNHDELDLGQLGVSSIDDLSITTWHGDTLINSVTGAFAGTIQLIGVDLINATGGPGAYLEFDGALN